MLKHLCGQCDKIFTSEDSYLRHQCPVTGYTPLQPQHFDSNPSGSKLTEKNILAAVRAIRRTKNYDKV